jgi:SprB repeat
LVFNVRGRLSCTANVSTRINVVNVAALLIDEDLQNNAVTLQYTLPVTVSTTQVNVTCNGAANGIINVTSSPGTTVVIRNSSNVVVTNTGLAPGVYSVTATAIGDAPLSNTCSNVVNVTIVQPVVLTAASTTTANNVCNAGTDGVITVTSAGGTAPYTYVIAGPTVNTTGATSGIFTGLAAGSYTITSTDANGCTATTTASVTQPTGTAPNISLGSDITSSFFATSGVSQTIVYNVAEIAGNPAVGDTIRITRVSGFTINLNTAIFSTVVGSTTYTLDNSRWKIDNTDPNFVSIILTNPLGAGPGTLLCNQRVNVAVTLTRNTTDISTFTLSARLRRANGELILNNNLNSIIMTAE